MNPVEQLKAIFSTFLTEAFDIAIQEAQVCTLELNTDEQKQQFGDLTSNAALILAKQLKQNPRQIAQEIAAKFSHPSIQKIEVAGPGFLNFFLTQKAFDQLSQEIYKQKKNFTSMMRAPKCKNWEILSKLDINKKRAWIFHYLKMHITVFI